MKMYEVGGCVRDELLGTPSKDIDFTVVLSGNEDAWHTMGGHNPFTVMVRELKYLDFKLIPEATKEEFLTARGFFPENHPIYPGKPADFVLARKEGEYTDGRRPDNVEVGTLFDDLSRRDFTMNAIAKDPMTGEYIDPYNGINDIKNRNIRTVGRAIDRLREDALRGLRALRFSVTKGFGIDETLDPFLDSRILSDAIRENISDERIREELRKMFGYDTVKSLHALSSRPNLTDAIFSGSVTLDATMKKRHTNK